MVESVIKIIYFLTLIFSTLKVSSQNLLLNGSFEINEGCPNGPNSFLACPDWSVPNESSPDLFLDCDSTYTFGVPINYSGHQEAKHGRAYIGLALLSTNSDQLKYREYVSGKLREELIKGEKYKVSLSVSMAEYSNFYFNKLGFKVSSVAEVLFLKNEHDQIKLSNIINNSSGYVKMNYDSLNKRDNWVDLEFFFKSKGGEKFITFGIFNDNISKSEFLELRESPIGYLFKNNWNGFYIYMDDIIVKRIF